MEVQKPMVAEIGAGFIIADIRAIKLMKLLTYFALNAFHSFCSTYFVFNIKLFNILSLKISDIKE